MIPAPSVNAMHPPLLAAANRVLTPQRLRRYPLIMFVVTVGMYMVVVVRSENWIEPDGKIIGRDFLAFYMAGAMINEGRLDHLYDFAAQTTFQQRFMADINPLWSGVCLYRNPPHYAAALSLLTPLGYGPALIAWWVLSGACFAVTALLWRRWLGPGRSGVAILLAVCVPAWFWALAGGQNTFFSLLIWTGFCGLLMSGRDFRAGLVLAALAFKFHFLVVPVGLLAFKGRWRALAGVGVGGLATLALTAAVLGPQSISDYLGFGANLGRVAQVEGFDLHKQHSWHGFFALLGQGWLPGRGAWLLTAAATVGSLILLGSIWRGRWSPRHPRFAVQLSALVMATLLTSPHLAHYDVLMAALPGVLWLSAAPRGQYAGVASDAVRVLLAVGFIWLAISPAVADLTHVQFTPWLMLAWLLIVRRALAEHTDGSKAGALPQRTIGGDSATVQAFTSSRVPVDRDAAASCSA
ncbi:MAG: DUF2029 domain-containing protein [Planctomycetes bacterium]|nr:DUF2029 domain-containing protein [Planctomycetota bacterium]